MNDIMQAIREKKQDMSQQDITHGKAVIAQEIEGLQALSDAMGQEFSAAVEIIATSKGRVILTGMGKSGHVARKIAATMASTGTPAHYVHPGEASHGDLGMITRNDVVVALSNSGETAELADIIGYCARFAIPLIAMVRRKSSMLVEGATVALVLPDTPEANTTNAPTTSTTMMMALGDAISVALMARNAFTNDDFSVFHPGGKLGKAFIQVKDLMHTGTQLPLAHEQTLMQDVLLIMTEKTFGAAAVINDNDELIGVITDGDLRRHLSPDMLAQPARDVMTANPLTIRPTALAAQALGIMNERSITSLFVVEDDKPVGILHIHDCLRAGIA